MLPFRTSLATFLLGLCLAAPACALAEAAHLDVAVPDIGAANKPSGGLLVDVIHEQHLLEQALAADGVDVRWHFFKGAAPLINEAFSNDQLDLAYLGDLGAIIGRSAGLDTRVVAVAGRGVAHYLAVPPGSPIHTLADLKGQRVGLWRGTAAQLSFIAALRTAGMSESDVRIINMDFPAASAALSARHIDATWGGANVLALRERGLAEIPLSSRDLGGAGDLSGLVVAGRLAREPPDWVAKIVAVQRQAADWAVAHPEEHLNLLANQSGYPEALLRADLQGPPTLAQRVSPTLDPAYLGGLREAIDIALKAHLIRRDVDLDAWLLPSPNTP
ncbi:MAG: putative aliphatic sulfonates-binding protein [Pseudomonas citronellolis]|nr:MAG: putative aliphatic sulfonates-binding protein [Pseudomonas citronellolis]